MALPWSGVRSGMLSFSTLPSSGTTFKQCLFNDLLNGTIPPAAVPPVKPKPSTPKAKGNYRGRVPLWQPTKIDLDPFLQAEKELFEGYQPRTWKQIEADLLEGERCPHRPQHKLRPSDRALLRKARLYGRNDSDPVNPDLTHEDWRRLRWLARFQRQRSIPGLIHHLQQQPQETTDEDRRFDLRTETA